MLQLPSLFLLLIDMRIKCKGDRADDREPHAALRFISELEHSGRSSSRCQEDDSEDDDSDNQEAAHSDAENDDQTNSTVCST